MGIFIKHVFFFIPALVLTAAVSQRVFKFKILPSQKAGSQKQNYGQNIKPLPIEIISEPVNLPPKPQDQNFGIDVTPGQTTVSIPADGYLELKGAQVINAPRQALHHADAFTNTGPILSLGRETLNGQVEEIASRLNGFGIEVKKGQLVNLTSHFRNDSAKQLNNVSVKISARFLPKESDLKPIKIIFLHINDPDRGGTEFLIPPKSHYKKDARYKIEASGKILLVGSHLHDFGKIMRASINGKPLHDFYPKITEHGEILLTPAYYPDHPIYLEKGDEVRFEVEYDNPNNFQVEGMGILTFIVEI